MVARKKDVSRGPPVRRAPSRDRKKSDNHSPEVQSDSLALDSAIVVDITERKKAEARQAMEHAVTRLLAEANTPSEVMPKIIQAICEALGCACGAYWIWDDRDQLLHCTATWSVPSPEMDEFIVLTRQATNSLETGVGLIGRTWTNREATWITDVTQDPSFQRAPKAAKAGLRAALGFPMLAQGEILGVIEIFSRDSRQPDEVLIQSVTVIGSQIGQFLQRKRAEEHLRRDISQRKRAEELLRLEHTVNRCLAEADSASGSIDAVIRAVCETERWECGRYFRVDEEAGVLSFGESWGVPEPAIQEFIERSRGITYKPGVGLMGRVWQSGQPLWVADVTKDARAVRSAFTDDLGIRGGFVFPIISEGKTIGTLAFNSREVREPEERLLQAIGVIGSQIGQFLQRKRAEEHLRRFRAAMDVSVDIVLLIDPANMRYVDVNDAACRALGYSREELLTMGPLDILPNSREELTLLYDRLIVGDLSESAAEILFRRKDGSRFTVESFRRAVPSAKGHIIVAVARDISERKRAQQLLTLEHTVNRALAEADSVAGALQAAMRSVCETEGWECGRYFRLDEKAGVMRFSDGCGIENAAIERFIAESRKVSYAPGVGFVGQVWQSGQPLWIADIGKDARTVQKTITREIGLHGAIFFPVISEGKTIGVLAFNSREVREPEEPLLQAILVIGSQIGQFVQRKQAEEALRQANQAHRALIETSPLAIFTYDLDGIVMLWNPAAERVYGWTEAEAVGHFLPAVKEDKKEEFNQLRDKTIRGEPLNNVELIWERRDGARIHVSVSIAPLYDAGGKLAGIMALSADISARKQAEARQAMEHSITRLLAESKDPTEAMPRILQTICETSGWDYGAYSGSDKQNQILRRGDTWSSPSIDATEFIASTKQEISRTAESSTGGMRRRAWITAEPVWASDVSSDPTFHRAAIAAKVGLHAGLAFPVLVDGVPIGVIELYSRDIRQQDELLLQSVRSLGSQVGQFYQRKQIEARQAMEHAVTGLLATSGTAAEAIPKILETICETLGWDYGGYWALDEQAQLFRCNETWNAPNIEVAEFVTLTRQTTNATGTGGGGVIRRVLAKGGTIWIADVTEDASFRRGAVAAKAGLHSAFAFPIMAGPEIIGVMEFFSHRIRQPDEILVEIARSIGIQIGQFYRRKQAEEKIQYLAYYDGLTALPNRILFNQRLNHALTQARRYKKPLAVLFIDLDRFKNINDTLGHEAGDRLLQEMATRLKGCLRESDTVARLGGDEFVILLEDIVDPKHAANVARKIIGTALNPFTLAGAEYHITASVGISVYPEDGEDEQTLMKHADIAMYLAKDHGKNNYQFYSTQINAHSFERLALESSLRRALERKEFLLHYQAKVDLATGKVTGMEALIRWQHVDLGMVSPVLFIPLAEETGLIVPIGRWVLKTACAQNRAWQDQGLPRLRISVNLSARQFKDDHLVEDVAQALKETGLDPELLELELTESMVMYNPDKAVKLLTAFKAMGVYLAIDDFGIGYSSLAHLKRFPIDTIKVDRSFIKDIMENREDAAITEAIIAMGKSLNLNVIAEGVETNDQVNFLRDHKCDEMQGFYFSKPLPDQEFADLLRKGTGLVQKSAS
jgi:diguanylate cyclase (GGDEF)-like protein/PAS domain S-box-containing protein